MPIAKLATDAAPESSNTVWFGLAGRLNDGAWFTAVTVIVNVCVALVSLPPFAVPPLSVRNTLTVADPDAVSVGV
jgi:hypothetical protein